MKKTKKQKDKTTAILLAFFLGGFGIHKFYLGKTTEGVFFLIFFWTFIPSVLAIINVLQMAFMDQEQFDKKYN